MTTKAQTGIKVSEMKWISENTIIKPLEGFEPPTC